MRSDADFAGYVEARWPLLVRTAVLLGCPEAAAADVVVDALARCQKPWGRIREDADVDGVVRGELVAAWDRLRSSAAWWPDGDSASPPTLDSALSGDLDALTPAQRGRVVLSRYAGAPGAGGLPAEPRTDRLVAGAALLPVLAAPSQEEIGVRRRAVARRRTRRSLGLGLAAALPVLLVALGLTWLANRTDGGDNPSALPRLATTRADNPTNVLWEADGKLHLQRVSVAIPTARQVAPMGAGAVYADRSGRVIRVASDGIQTLLGHEDTDAGFVSSDSQGWTAWVDPTGARAELVVVDAESGRTIGRLPLARGETVRPVAIDGETLYYADGQGARGWQPEQQRRPAYVVEPAVLLDVASKTRLYQVGELRLQISEPLAGATVPLRGIGGRLSADGLLLVTRTRGDSGGAGPIAIYDTRTGASLQTGVADDELAIDAAFGADQTITYLIARRADRPSASDELRSSFAGSTQLRTCHLFLAPAVPPVCGLASNIPVSGPNPMLAH